MSSTNSTLTKSFEKYSMQWCNHVFIDCLPMQVVLMFSPFVMLWRTPRLKIHHPTPHVSLLGSGIDNHGYYRWWAQWWDYRKHERNMNSDVRKLLFDLKEKKASRQNGPSTNISGKVRSWTCANLYFPLSSIHRPWISTMRLEKGVCQLHACLPDINFM